jgi:hypothetical protein
MILLQAVTFWTKCEECGYCFAAAVFSVDGDVGVVLMI